MRFPPLYKGVFIGYNILGEAEVAELADALCSGRSGSILVWVQIPPSAPFSKLFEGLSLSQFDPQSSWGFIYSRIK